MTPHSYLFPQKRVTTPAEDAPQKIYEDLAVYSDEDIYEDIPVRDISSWYALPV